MKAEEIINILYFPTGFLWPSVSDDSDMALAQSVMFTYKTLNNKSEFEGSSSLSN